MRRHAHDAICFVPKADDVARIDVIFEDDMLGFSRGGLTGCQVDLKSESIDFDQISAAHGCHLWRIVDARGVNQNFGFIV